MKRAAVVVSGLLAVEAIALILLRNSENWRVGRYLFQGGFWVQLGLLGVLLVFALASGRIWNRWMGLVVLCLVAVLATDYAVVTGGVGLHECRRPRMSRGAC